MKGMLSCKSLVDIVRNGFSRIKDTNSRSTKISLVDNLMSGYALFSLKYSSLLQFDRHYHADTVEHNLKAVYQIQQAPSDTQMRTRLDEVDPKLLRRGFKNLFAQCQRSKRLELFKYYDDKYLLALDGTGYFYSNEVHCDNCCQKNHRDGTISYYHQMLNGVLVHPNQKVVLPFAPEPIMKTDGVSKNDCERNAAKRFMSDFKREHPHLDIIVTGDSLFSNGPFIKGLLSDQHSFILVAKEKDHKSLFENFRSLEHSNFQIEEQKTTHRFSWLNGLPLNDSHPDCLVNVLEYWEEHSNGKTQHWVWVTNISLNQENVFNIMRGGRARHRIENETFNTLKNQGYNFEHNFGHGKKNLSTVFSHLMLLAFFVDQLQQLGCDLYKKALARLKKKKDLWETQRGLFFNFLINSLEDLWSALAYDHQKTPLAPNTS